MYIIAGLGNPDARYQNTRHNAGFDAIDVIAEKNHIPLDTIKYNALSGSGFIGGQKVLLVKPLTYMNLSGEAIIEFVGFSKLIRKMNFLLSMTISALNPAN